MGRSIGWLVRHGLALAALGAALACGYAGDARKSDALPDGALMRFGSLRWRHSEPITFLAFTPDGKSLVSAGQDSIVRLWDRETGLEIRRFVPPPDTAAKVVRVNANMQGLTRAALSRDGKLLAVALQSNAVQLWDVDTGKALRQINAPASGTAAIAFTPDGKTLAIRGVSDRICLLHDTETGKEIRKLKALPPDGKGGNIFGGASDGTGLAIAHNGKIIALPELEFDGKRVSGSVTLFDIDTGKEIRRIESPTNGIGSIAFAPDDKTLAFNTHSTVVVVNAETGKEIRQIKPANGASLIVFAPDGQTLALKGRDQLVRLYDANTGNLVRTLGELPGQKGVVGLIVNANGAVAADVAFARDGKTIAIGGQHVPRFFNAGSGEEARQQDGGHLGPVTALAAVDGKTIASRGAEGIVRVWNADTGVESCQFHEPRGTSAVAFAPDGKLVAFGNNDGNVRLLDTADGTEKRLFKAHQGNVATIAFSPDGTKLATRGRYDGHICVFDAGKGTELKKITYQTIEAGNNGAVFFRTLNPQIDVQPLVFSPDGQALATFVATQQVIIQGRQQPLPDSNCLRVFDVNTGQELKQIPMPANLSITQLAYSRDGRLLISANLDKTISLWEVASGQERARLGQPSSAVPPTLNTGFVFINGNARSGPATLPVGVTIAASSDGNLIAVGGADNAINLFDPGLSKQVGTLRGHDGAIASLAFAADSKSLMSGGSDATVLIWDLARLKREAHSQVAFQSKELNDLWADLMSADAKTAGKSVQSLIAGSKDTLTFLKDHLHPTAPADPKAVAQWLRDLDSSNFTKRAIAMKQLEKLGELAIPALRKMLASEMSLETRRRVEPMLEELTGRNFTPAQLRVIRSVEVLERIGTPEAQQLLERLADGAPGSLTTLQAQIARRRIGATTN